MAWNNLKEALSFKWSETVNAIFAYSDIVNQNQVNILREPIR